jgi:hypothetical protein
MFVIIKMKRGDALICGGFYELHLIRSAVYPAHTVERCFSTAGPRPGTGPRHQLYRAERGSPGS